MTPIPDRSATTTADLFAPSDIYRRMLRERKLANYDSADDLGGLMRVRVDLTVTQQAIYTAHEDEMVLGDGYVAFLPIKPGHMPDGWGPPMLNVSVNGGSVTPDAALDLLGHCEPAAEAAPLVEAIRREMPERGRARPSRRAE